MKTIALLLLILLCQFSFAQNGPSSINSTGSDCQKHVTEIPFEFKDGIIVLKASFNHGKNMFDFVLDSGAPTVITSDALMTSFCRTLSGGDIQDFSYNTQNVSHYVADDLVIADKDFRSVELWSNDQIKDMPVLQNRADGGLIGANVMKGAIWMIDYQNKKIMVADKLDNLSLGKVMYKLPMNVTDAGSPVVKITLPNQKDQNALVDLGCNQSVILPYRLLHDTIIGQSLSRKEVRRLSSGFLSEEATIQFDTLPFMDIGDMRVQNVNALFPKNNNKTIIGNDFLKNFDVVFDFIHHELLLIPANQSISVETLSASSDAPLLNNTAGSK